MNDTTSPAPLSADSLRKLQAELIEELMQDQPMAVAIGKWLPKQEAYIAAALQSERQRIADCLIVEANTYSNDGDFSDDAPSLVEAVPVEAVRAVLIPPTGGLETSDTASAGGNQVDTPVEPQ